MEKLNKLFSNIIRVVVKDKEHPWANSLEQLDWVQTNIKNIKALIKTKNSPATRKNYYLAFGKVYEALGDDVTYKAFKKLAVKEQNKIKDRAKHQKLSDARIKKFVDWSTLIKKRDQLAKTFMHDKSNNQLNLQYLLMALYIYLPIRNNYVNVKIVDKMPCDNDNNYLLKVGDKYIFYLNKDKVSHAKGGTVYPFTKTMSKIITNSLKAYPREYLLGDMTKRNVIYQLNKMFPDKTVSIVNIRSAKISHFYNQNKSVAQKQKLAKRMRHSVSEAIYSYQKVVKNTKKDKMHIKRLTAI